MCLRYDFGICGLVWVFFVGFGHGVCDFVCFGFVGFRVFGSGFSFLYVVFHLCLLGVLLDCFGLRFIFNDYFCALIQVFGCGCNSFGVVLIWGFHLMLGLG